MLQCLLPDTFRNSSILVLTNVPLYKPDYGQAVPFNEGEIPVFWACGVTPQFVVENVKPPLAISHRPGYMFISDILNTEIEDKLAAREK